MLQRSALYVSIVDDEEKGGKRTHDHCANHPCKVTAPSSPSGLRVVIVVSGQPPASQGLPGAVENRLSSSEGERAPSRSCEM